MDWSNVLTSGSSWQDSLDGLNRWPLISGGLSQQRAAWAGIIIWTTHLMPGSQNSWHIVRSATVVTANRSDVTDGSLLVYHHHRREAPLWSESQQRCDGANRLGKCGRWMRVEKMCGRNVLSREFPTGPLGVGATVEAYSSWTQHMLNAFSSRKRYELGSEGLDVFPTTCELHARGKCP